MTDTKSRRLLLIGSTQSDVHLRNYYGLIKGTFDEVLLVSGTKVDFCECKQLHFGLKNPIALRKTVRSLRSIIDDFSPSVIHVHQANVYGYVTALANKRKIPQILTIWGSDVLLLPNKNFVFKHIVKKALRGAHSITADAAFIGKKVTSLIGEHNFTVANFGIDLPNITLDISKKEKIVYSNRLHAPLYNIDAIIRGFIKFREQHPDWKLIIGGSGPLTEELKSIAAQLPDEAYSFIGFVDYETNMEYYQRASIFISIPSSDGTSISLLEAMACGTIPVLSNLPANKEWVDSGKNGIIVEKDLFSSLEAALKLNAESVAKENQLIIDQKATKNSNRAVFIDLYKQLLD